MVAIHAGPSLILDGVIGELVDLRLRLLYDASLFGDLPGLLTRERGLRNGSTTHQAPLGHAL